MASFNYQNAQNTAQRLIKQFGVATKLARVSGSYDPVTGATSSESTQTTDATVVSLPTTNSLGLKGDDKFMEDLKRGKVRGFYVAAKDLTFEPQSGDFLLFQGAILDIAAVTPLNPAGTPVLFSIGCRSGAKQPSDLGL